MMFQKNAGTWKIVGKRGSNKLEAEKKFTGWFIGYARAGRHLIFYVNYIETKDMNHPTIIDMQKKIAYAILESQYPEIVS